MEYDRHGDGAECDYACAGDEVQTCREHVADISPVMKTFEGRFPQVQCMSLEQRELPLKDCAGVFLLG